MAARFDKLVLVGLPGSGKSTVGSAIAQKLGWRFIDLDTAIEESAGLRVPQIFAQHGEAEFRRIEHDLTARLAWEPRIVLSPGGGWILHNELPGALVVWLAVEPHEAVRRLGAGVAGRPLLQPDPLQRMQQLLAEREQYYEKADIHIDTNGKSADRVAAAVVLALEEEDGH